jgi:hypothetical protein
MRFFCPNSWQALARRRRVAAIISSTALLLFAQLPGARAETFLDAVLFVLTGADPAHSYPPMSEEQTADTIHTVLKARSFTYTTTIRRIGLCKVEATETGLDYGDGEYTVDFTQARFDDLNVIAARSARGVMHNMHALPGAVICVTSGVNFYNAAIKPGACVDRLNVGIVSPSGSDVFLRRELDRIRAECNALSINDRRSEPPGPS